MRGTWIFIHFQASFPSLGWFWGGMSGICCFCITSLFTSHLEIKQLPSYSLIYSSVDGSFCLSRFKTEKNQDSFPSIFKLSGSLFQFQSGHFCPGLQQDLPSPAPPGLGLSGAIPGKYARVLFQGLFSDSWRLGIFGHGVFSILFKQQAQPTLSWSLVKFWWNVTPCPSCLCSFLVLTAKAAVCSWKVVPAFWSVHVEKAWGWIFTSNYRYFNIVLWWCTVGKCLGLTFWV